MKKLYRGVSDRELKGYKNGLVPSGTQFTTNISIANAMDKNVIEVNFNLKKFKLIDSYFNIKCNVYSNKVPVKFRKKVLL